MRTIDQIMKGEDRTMFILKSQMSFKFFGDRVLGLNVEPHHEKWVEMVEDNKRVLVIAFTGSGKSIRRGTKVIMYDGSIKKAEDVKQNDLLMGDDSTPRKVLQTTEGFGKIYTIKQSQGMTYYTNDAHILSLKNITTNKYINISIDEYKAYSNKDELKGYKLQTYSKQLSDIQIIDENIQDNWYGFILDGNKRFLLEDFTVTHNSEIMAIAYPLWKIFQTHGWDALIISKSLKQATSLLERIKSAISDNELLKDLIPKKDTWNKTEINTRNRCKMSCVPYNENVKGYHVDYVLADEASSYVDKEIYYRFVETRVNSKNGTVCLITTPQHPSDLSQDLLDNPYYATQILKVLDEDNNPVSKRFPLSRITEIRRTSEMTFRKEYMCDVSIASETPFDMNDIIACFDDNRKFTMRHEDYIGTVYSGHDFAVSKVGDYSVSVFIDKVEDDLVLKYIERTRGVSIPEQEDRLVELHSMLNPVTMLVDESNMGQGIKQHLIDKIPIQGQLFSPAKRHDLLMNLKRTIETGHLIIPHAEDELTSTIIDEMVKELSSFKSARTPSGQQTLQSRSKHDDLVIGLALAVKAATAEMEFVDYIATDYHEIEDMTNVL